MKKGLRITRRPGESILLSGGVRITYEGNQGRRSASLIIQAPDGIIIAREEVAHGDLVDEHARLYGPHITEE